MRIAGTIWLQVLLLVAMFAFSAMVLRPELAEAASRKRGEETLTGPVVMARQLPWWPVSRWGLYSPTWRQPLFRSARQHQLL